MRPFLAIHAIFARNDHIREDFVIPFRLMSLDRVRAWSGEQRLAFAVIVDALASLRLPHSPTCLNFRGGPLGGCERCELEAWLKAESDTIYQLTYLCDLFDINPDVFRRYAWTLAQNAAQEAGPLNSPSVLRDSVASFIEIGREDTE